MERKSQVTDLLDSLAKPPPPPSELDELMSRNPLDLTKDPAEYKAWTDKVIAYQRNARAAREAPAGGRRKRSDLTDMTDKPIDLAALGLLKPKVTAVPTAKLTTGGFRRL